MIKFADEISIHDIVMFDKISDTEKHRLIEDTNCPMVVFGQIQDLGCKRPWMMERFLIRGSDDMHKYLDLLSKGEK